MIYIKQKLLILTLLIFTTSTCFSSEPIREDNNQTKPIQRRWDFGIGIGYGNSSNPFIGANDIVNNFSLDFSLYGERFFFDNGELGFTLIEQKNFGLNLITTYNTERIYYSYFNDLGVNLINTGNNLVFDENSISELNSDNYLNDNMNPGPIIPSPLPPDFISLPFGPITLPLDIPDKNFALNLGVEILYNSVIGDISAQFSHDISNTHNGYDFILDFGKSWHRKRWHFASQIGIHWKSRKLIDYYYGLDYNFNSLFELQYKGKSSLDSYLNVRASYRLTNHVSFVASCKLFSFGSSIRNSPLIAQNSKSIFFTGLYYRF